MATTWRQEGSRFRLDDGNETGASWLTSASNANATISIYGNKNYRVRIGAFEWGTTGAALTPYLYISKNASGSYARIPTVAGPGLHVVDSTNFSDDAATTKQLFSGSAFIAGKMDDVSGSATATATINQYYFTEHEYNFQLDYANIANGDYFDFREYATTNPFATYTFTGRLTITKWVMNNAAQAQTADNVVLTARGPSYTLTVQNAGQGETSDNLILTYHAPALAVNNATQTLTSEAIGLSAHYSILVNNASQLQTAGNTVLSAHYAIITNNATQAQTADKITITGYIPTYSLTVNNTIQLQTAGNIIITGHIPTYSLTVGNAYQVQFVNNVILLLPVTYFTLEIQNAQQLQTVDNIVFPTPPVYHRTYSGDKPVSPQIQIAYPVIGVNPTFTQINSDKKTEIKPDIIVRKRQ
jgi:hypothetical protein